MLKGILGILSLLVMCSCVVNFEEEFRFNDVQFESYEEVYGWCVDNIEYDEDLGWQNPNQTLSNKEGNCTSITILTLYIINYQFDRKGEMACMVTDTGKHACPKVGKNYLGKKYRTTYIYTFDEINNKLNMYSWGNNE